MVQQGFATHLAGDRCYGRDRGSAEHNRRDRASDNRFAVTDSERPRRRRAFEDDSPNRNHDLARSTRNRNAGACHVPGHPNCEPQAGRLSQGTAAEEHRKAIWFAGRLPLLNRILTMLRSKLLAVVLGCSVALFVANARGQGKPAGSDDTTQKEARALFEKGKALGKKKDWQGSYEMLLRSFELRASHDTAANLAYAATKAGKHAEAARFAAYAIRMMPTAEPEDKRAAVENMLSEAKKEVTTVSLTVKPPKADILVNGVSIGSAEELLDPIFLSPGDHVIEAHADGYETAREPITATRSTERALPLTLTPRASGAAGSSALPDSGLSGTQGNPPAGQDPTQNGKTEPNILPVVLVGGGITLIATGIGIGFLIASNGTESDADDLGRELDALGGCGAGSPHADRCASRLEKYETADRQRNISTVGFIGAGVAAVGTVAYVLLTSGEDRSSNVGSRVQPVGSLSRGGFALGVGGAF
jgi:hypothetical protein